MPQTSVNAFLGGQLQIAQPLRGYRAGVDPVFLAASVPARAGQRVLELGCGVGTAALCLGRRVPGLELAGVEIQADYADLARRNAKENKINLTVHTADLTDLPSDLKKQHFDHVIANPPYFDRRKSSPSPHPGRETAFGEETPLDVWVDVAARRLAPKGYATFIHRAERLPDLLASLGARLGSLQVQPLAPRRGRDATLLLVRGRKGGRATFRLHAPLVLHEGDAHGADGEDYTTAVSRILRNGAALGFPA